MSGSEHATPEPPTPEGHGPGEHGSGEHHPFQAHHWDTMRQQFEAGKLGMWLFLATEVLLFGGLFCAYFIYRSNNPELFEYGHNALNKWLGAGNTIVLLVSSLTMALGVRAAQVGETKKLRILLALTFVCGCGFMSIKYIEYSEKIGHGYLLGSKFDYEKVKEHEREAREAEAHTGGHETEVFAAANIPAYVPAEKSAFVDAPRGPSGIAPIAEEVKPGHGAEDGAHGGPGVLPSEGRPRNAHIFFSIYFMMTGLHGIHVLIGMAVIAWLFVTSRDNRFGPSYFAPVEIGGLYWHLVDLIWIYLFPLLYLI